MNLLISYRLECKFVLKGDKYDMEYVFCVKFVKNIIGLYRFIKRQTYLKFYARIVQKVI